VSTYLHTDQLWYDTVIIKRISFRAYCDHAIFIVIILVLNGNCLVVDYLKFAHFSAESPLVVMEFLKDIKFKLAPIQVPIIDWLPEYKWKETLPSDLNAGVTVFMLLIPQGMAYAVLAGNVSLAWCSYDCH
jgi:hypothetical protein